jgi:hypothetical protein
LRRDDSANGVATRQHDSTMIDFSSGHCGLRFRY